MDITAGQPRSRRRASSDSTRGWRTSLLSCQPAARTRSSAITALTVAAATASGMPSAGPNSRPAASVNAVRGKGKTVITMCAARNASGNHGPTEFAQSRSCSAVGSGTSRATATRITIAARMAKTRRGGTVDAVANTAARSARTVLTTVFTSTKTTGRGVRHPASGLVSRPPGGRGVTAII